MSDPVASPNAVLAPAASVAPVPPFAIGTVPKPISPATESVTGDVALTATVPDASGSVKVLAAAILAGGLIVYSNVLVRLVHSNELESSNETLPSKTLTCEAPAFLNSTPLSPSRTTLPVSPTKLGAPPTVLIEPALAIVVAILL